MSFRPTFDPQGSASLPVDKLLGNAYPIVKTVYDHLPAIDYLAENIDGLVELTESNKDAAAASATLAQQAADASAASAAAANDDRLASQEAAESTQENANLAEASRINAEESELASQSWSSLLGAAVTPGLYSAKEWATGVFTRGQVGGGSSKDWASYLGGPVDGTDYSAKQYANDANASLVAAKNVYYGNAATDPTTRPDGSARVAGDRYYSTSSSAEKVWSGSAWVIPNVGATDLANLTDASKGSALVGFFQNLTGSIARTVRSKLLDLLSQKDFGAVGDNVADDRNALNAATATGKDIWSASGTYKATNTVTLGAGTYRAGRGAVHNNSTLFSYRIGAGADVDGGVWNATGGVAFDVLAATVDASLRNLKISNTSGSNATAVNVAAAGVDNLRIHGASITANGFGVLTNSGGTVDGMIVSASYISSGSDAIELNAPGVSHKNFAIFGNILRANGAGTGHTSGFAVGIAAAKNVAVVGNAIKESTWEAIHIEDQHDTLSVIGNVGQNLHGDFIRASTDGVGGTGGTGFPIIGNNAKSYGAGLANYGAFLVWNVNGSIAGMTVMGNRFAGFDTGLIGGNKDAIASGNVLESCGVAGVQSAGGGYVYGANLIRGTTTLAKTSQGTLLGRVISDSVPTTILDTSGHAASTIGTVLEDGFAFRGLAPSIPGSATTAINLFALPKLMQGRLIVRFKHSSAAAYIYASADVIWDGTTLTVSNTLKDQAGSIAWSGTTFTASGGQLQMSIFNSGATFTATADVILKGEFYK